jgi:hypothetical protein
MPGRWLPAPRVAAVAMRIRRLPFSCTKRFAAATGDNAGIVFDRILS